jgi:PelA/Pel-15E family pectate lyase
MNIPTVGARLFVCLIMMAAAPGLARATDVPRAWPENAFRPVTEARINSLAAAEQPAWRAYWDKSQAFAKDFSGRDLAEHTPNQRVAGPPIGASYSQGVKLHESAAWYAKEEARLVADRVVNWQLATGGWTKSGDYTRNRQASDDHHDAWSCGTFDNDSTIYEMRYLALVITAAGEDAAVAAPRTRAWRAGFARGLDYVLAAQYPNGGFPQIYPLAGGYHDAITYNDYAMVHILELLRDISARTKEFAFVTAEQVTRSGPALELGIRCVLSTQLRDAAGQPTIWGQQHDALDLTPCAARNFEPIAECSRESVGLVEFLMSIPHPSPGIVAAVEGAMAWFPRRAIHGMKWPRHAPAGTDLEPAPGAPDLWARYYEIGTGKPVFGERDRRVHYSPAELTLERRNGYAWFNDQPAKLFPLYAKWKESLLTAAATRTP